MNKLIKPTAAVLAAGLIFCGCSRQTEADEAVTSMTLPPASTTAPEADHSLLRGYTINEVFADIYAGGRKFTFPVSMLEFEEGGTFDDCTLTDSSINFPDGSFFSVKIAGEGESVIPAVMYLSAEEKTAPDDFKVCGLNMGMSVADVYADFGIPDNVGGDPKQSRGNMTYIGAGTQVFTLEFERNHLTKIIFQQ